MLRAVVLAQYRRVTDGRTDGRTDRQTDRQTDGIAVASTALAMRVFRRAVKILVTFNNYCLLERAQCTYTTVYCTRILAGYDIRT